MNTVYADDYGFNGGDATDALQKAINDTNADKIVVRKMDSPWLISKPIFLQSNKEIVFEEGVVVQAKSGSFLENNRGLFFGRDLENVKLIGQGTGENKATLKMNKEEYTKSEYGHVISLLGVKDFQVSGLNLTGGGGDGLHIAGGAYDVPDPNYRFYSENGLVENITSDNNRRSGLSIDSAKNLVVRNSSFTNNSGTAPSAGINLEPTWDFETLQNITIEDVNVSGNGVNGIQIPYGNLDDSSEAISVDFKNITLENTKNNAIFITGKYLAQGSDYGSEYKGEPNQSLPSSRVNGTINFSNINISNAEAIANSSNPSSNPGTYVFVESVSGNQDDPSNLKVNFDNLHVKDPADTPLSTTPLFIQGLPGADKPKEIGNLALNDVTIDGNYELDVVRADLGRPDANLNNISGDITVNNSDPSGAGSFFAQEDQAKNFSLTVTEGNGEVSTEPEPVTEEVEAAPDNAEVPALENVPVAEAVAVNDEATLEVSDSDSIVTESTAIESTPEPVAEEVEPTDVEEVIPDTIEELPSTDVVETAEAAEIVTIDSDLDTVGSEENSSSTDSVTGSVEIINSSFKDDLTGWVAWSDNISVVERSEGDRWTSINSGEGGIGQNITEQLIPGADYQITATTQSELDAEGYVGVRFATEDNEAIDIPEQQVATNTTQDLQFGFTAPEEFGRAEIFAWKSDDSGTLFVDDFSLTQTKENSQAIAENSNEEPSVELNEPNEPIASSVEVANSSFEDSLSGWSIWNDGVSVEERLEGDRWASISSAESGIGQRITEQIIPGANYQITADAQLAELGTDGYVGVRFSSENNEIIDLQYQQVTGDTAQKVQLDFTAPEEFGRAEVFAWRGDGEGTLLVDDFSLTQT